MTINPYEAPRSDVGADENLVQDSVLAQFYVVSPKKFAILFVSTLSIYSLYWFYKNWSQYKKASKTKLWAVPRAIFAVLFIHNLFKKVDKAILDGAVIHAWNPNLLAWLFILLAVSSRVLDRLAAKSVFSPYSDLLSIAVALLEGGVLYKAQFAINAACNDPEGKTNETLTTSNIIIVLIGAIIWTLTIIGVVYPFVKAGALGK